METGRIVSEELRKIFLRHLWEHNSKVDGPGRPYGWTNDEIDALITEIRGETS